MAVDKFLGNALIKRLEKKQFKNIREVQQALLPDTDIGCGNWVDLAGLLAPAQIVGKLLDDIEKGTVNSLEQLKDRFESMHRNYYAYGWTWAADVLQKRLHKTIDRLTTRDVIDLVNQWKTSVVKLDNLLYSDAKKEFAATAKIGFGLAGDNDIKNSDFEAVRGKFEQNSFVAEIKRHITAKTELADELVSRMKKIASKETAQ